MSAYNYQSFEFRRDEDSPDHFLWQVYSHWQKGKNNLIAAYDITSPQMTVLTAIYWLIQNGHTTIQTAIAEAANMDTMTTSTVLRTLEKKALVKREEHPQDTRAKVVRLTPEGIRITVEALNEVNAYNIHYFAALGHDKAAFVTLLKKTLNSNKMQTNHVSRYQTIIKASVEKVWEGLTTPSIVKQYFFGSDLQADWKVGSPLIWKGDYEGTTYTDKGVVLELVPNQKLVFSYLSSWAQKEDKPENYLRVSYELQPVEAGTELVITQTNYDEEKVKHSEENWGTVIDGLKKIVEN